jgi:hypothetical protein
MDCEAFLTMLMEFLYHLGLFPLAALSMGCFLLLAVGGVFLVHRLSCRWSLGEGFVEFGSLVCGPIGNVFALVFALVTLAIWQNYDRVGTQVSEEAAALHNIYRTVESYPPEVRDPARAGLKTYVRLVVENEWKRLASVEEGDEDEAAHDLITVINAGLVAYRPKTLGELPVHQVLLTEIGRVRALRHSRLESGRAYMDPGMWLSMDLGALILLAYCSVWRVGNGREHLLLAAALGASLGLVFFLMILYNHPFAGPAAISPTPFQALLRGWG